jgi:molecular chaperone GrpE
MNEPKKAATTVPSEEGKEAVNEVPEASAEAAEALAESGAEAAEREAPAGPADAEPEAEEPTAEPEEEDPLAAAQAEIADLKDKLLRAVAETENVRRRAARDRDDANKYAITGFARDLLSVADNMLRAVASVPEDARQDDENLNTLLEGVELTQRELQTVFDRHGIRPIEPMGEKFDHNWHQAVVELPDPDAQPGTVVQVIQIGYAIADRLLRPAMVAVAKNDGGGGPGDKVDTTA